MSVGRGSRPLAVCLAIAGILVTAAGSYAQTGGWRSDERILITDFGIVTALARSPSSVFAATTGGLIVFDESYQKIAPPITVEDGYPGRATTAMVFDYRDRSVWLAAAGDLFQFDPFSRQFRDRINVGRPMSGLVPATQTQSDLYVRIGAEWWAIDTFSRDRRRADPGAVRQAIDSRSDLREREEALRDPFFVDAAEQAIRTWRGEPAPLLDVMPSRDAYVWWLASGGTALWRYDTIGQDAARSPVGPVGEGMAAVAASRDAVWFAPERHLEGRYGVASVTPDLQRWRVWRSDSVSVVPAHVNDLVLVSGGAWAGGEDGLHWMGDGRSDWRKELDVGLSYLPVLSLASASGPSGQAVWVGTARGLLRVRAAGGGIDLSAFPSDVIRAVAEAEGTVWVGTDRGVFFLPVPDSIGQTVAPGRPQGPVALRAPVGALVASGDTIYAGLDRDVWWKPGSQASWARLEAAGRARSNVSALAIRDGVLWVGSAAELTVAEVRGGVVGRYSFGPDLPPGPLGETGISDISIVSETEAWVAVPAGAIRLEVRH